MPKRDNKFNNIKKYISLQFRYILNKFKKQISKTKNLREDLFYDTLYGIRDIKVKINKKIEKNRKNNFIGKIKNKIEIIGSFFAPMKKDLWINDFKNFIIIFLFIIFGIIGFVITDDFINDLTKIKAITVFAKDTVEDGLVDLKNLNTKLAQDKFYIAFHTIYNIDDEFSFLTNKLFNIVGNVANFNQNDLEIVAGSLDNISYAITSLSKNLNTSKDFLYKSNKVNEAFSVINKNIEIIDEKISAINIKILPAKYKNDLVRLQTKISFLKENSKKIYTASNLLKDLMGQNQKQRYLLVFQNANEIRPTGGFIGSYALLDVYKGKIVNTEIPAGGTYDLQGGFYKNIEPPMPFKILVNKWEIQDSNWFFDFNKSANKIMDFFEAADGGSSVDGVVAINSDILSNLIKIFGDINLEKYNISLNSNNVIDEIQNIISEKRDKTTKPKEIIGDLFSVVSDKIFNSNLDILKSIEFLDNSMGQKQILMYFKNQNTQKNVESLNLDGYIKSTDNNDDYLAIVDTNIGGGKTSKFIERNVYQYINILPNGEVIKTIKLNRSYINQNKDNNVRNIEYIRLYVPEGSQLVSAYGFSDDVVYKNSILPNQTKDKDLDGLNNFSIKDKNTNTIIYNDEGKTIFGNFLYLDQGDSKEIVITYKLPFRLDKNTLNYSLYMQKQPGITSFYDIKINYSFDKFEALYKSDNDLDMNGYKLKLDKDEMIGIVLKNKK